jgi:hypothetical protein
MTARRPLDDEELALRAEGAAATRSRNYDRNGRVKASREKLCLREGCRGATPLVRRKDRTEIAIEQHEWWVHRSQARETEDQERGDCARCASTGRRCDGYIAPARPTEADLQRQRADALAVAQAVDDGPPIPDVLEGAS